MSVKITRRDFLCETAAGSVVLGVGWGAEPAAGSGFASAWHAAPDRVWLGPEYWANPLQDWRVAGGRIECIKAAPERNVHLLTRALADRPGELRMSVRVGRVGGRSLGDGSGRFGFRVGIQGPLREYRNSLLFGRGLDAGLDARGRFFLGDAAANERVVVDLGRESIELRLDVTPGERGYRMTLAAHDPSSGTLLGRIARSGIPAERLVGNLALAANFAAASARGSQSGQARSKSKAASGSADAGRFWFDDWRVSGSKVEAHDDRAFGPILFSQYTLSRGILKLTVQMPPLGPKDDTLVRLQVRRGGGWTNISDAPIHPEARTATFRIEPWDDTVDIPYRLSYMQRSVDGTQTEHFWSGTVRRDPEDAAVLTVADVSCNMHSAFPNAEYVANMAQLNPDVLAFTGDQFYEPSGGYGVQRAPLDAAILDVLRKWYLHGWTWRELMRDRPSISIPDDHDVYQGNIWGEGGAAQRGTQEMGGYQMPPAWVNVVHRTQTSHHPDPADPTPIQQGISVYYGSMTYGGVSFAILADRQFKSGPEGKVPSTHGRGDHVLDPIFDPKTADVPGVELLGERQMRFLREWAADWKGAQMKAVISQTIFTAMATTHGRERERLRADYDTNGWPQAARNAALREIRKAFAFHLAGDQHLPAVVHYGIEHHGDAGLAFASPTVNNLYPRWWEPRTPGLNRPEGAGKDLGDFLDSFGHPLTVKAVANPRLTFRTGVLDAERDKAAGLGIVRFHKRSRTITIECWPYLADVTRANTQFPGWPVTVALLDNYGRKATAYLPHLQVVGVEQPVVQVIDETTREVIYTIRCAAPSFQPFVFAQGCYTLRVSDPETGRVREFTGLSARSPNDERLKVAL